MLQTLLRQSFDSALLWAVTVLVVEFRVESSSVIRCATSVCPDLAVQLITKSIDEQLEQPPQPQPSSTTVCSLCFSCLCHSISLLYISVGNVMARWLAVHSPVISIYYIQTAKLIPTLFSLSASFTVLVFCTKCSSEIPPGSLLTGAWNAGVVWKIAMLD